MCSDETNSHQGDTLKLLKLGYMGRRRLISAAGCFIALSQEAHMMPTRHSSAEKLPAEPNDQTLETGTGSTSPQTQNADFGTKSNNDKDRNTAASKGTARPQRSVNLKSANCIARKGTKDALDKPSKKAGGQICVVGKCRIKPSMQSDTTKTKKTLITSKKQVPASAVSCVTQKRPSVLTKNISCAAELAKGQSTDPKSSSKRHKQNGSEIDAEPPLLSTRNEAHRSVEPPHQNMWTAQPEQRGGHHDLCAHHVRPHNCPKCIKHTFTSWKPRTIDDISDNNL